MRLFLPMAIKLSTLCSLDEHNPLSVVKAIQNARSPPENKDDVATALGLKSCLSANLVDLPLSIIIMINHDNTAHEVGMQIMVSATWSTPLVPAWAQISNGYMWCWKQVPVPVPTYGTKEGKGKGKGPPQWPPHWLIQYSTKTKVPILTVYHCSMTQRLPVAGFSEDMLRKENAQPDLVYTCTYQIFLESSSMQRLLCDDDVGDFCFPTPLTEQPHEEMEQNNDYEDDEEEETNQNSHASFFHTTIA